MLENQSDINLANFTGKKLIFFGYERIKTISSDDDSSQQPVDMTLDANGNPVTKADFTCTVLVIKKKL